MAFSRAIRKEIGQRDHWQCLGIDKDEPCVWEAIQGKPASYQDGFWVMASHWNHAKTNYYDEPENGRTQCLCCHYLYERKIGSYGQAEALARKYDVYTWDVRDNPESYPDLDLQIHDVKDVLRLYREARVAMA